jgi:hypothetical protein
MSDAQRVSSHPSNLTADAAEIQIAGSIFSGGFLAAAPLGCGINAKHCPTKRCVKSCRSFLLSKVSVALLTNTASSRNSNNAGGTGP